MKPFSLTGDRYDQDTYIGRLRRMLDICDPTSLINSEASIREAERKLAQFQSGFRGYSDIELWQARKLKESAIHPDTGQIIPAPFRMSGFVPFNGPVSVGAMVATRTPWILFWHWVNQSQNALVNYFNRNASSHVTNETLIMSYAGAVTSAICIAYGLSSAVKATMSPDRAIKVLRLVAMPTSMIASSVNCYIVRRPELETGIMVYDEQGKELGLSKAAAKKSMSEVIFSRMVLPIPVFGVPPLLMSVPIISRFLLRNPRMTLPVSASFLMLGFGFGLPASIAAFPQKGSISASLIEPELKAHGTVTYNKGL